MTLKIDKGIPIPHGNTGNQHARKYPFDKMEVGDSVFVASADRKRFGWVNTHYKPKRFTRKTVTEDGVTGVRIWRVE